MHISVCICTYRRPAYLKRLLEELAAQETRGRFTYSILVVDNDVLQSAEPIVTACAASAPVAVQYCVEPEQNIALARNRAVENAAGDFLAFIDDDEFPRKSWLLTLFTICEQNNVDGALGPVKPCFEPDTPAWVVKGRFWDRPTYPTGLVIDWRKGRTGNVLLRKQVFAGEVLPFRPEFRTGEDMDFFRRMIAKGYTFIWCDEAVAYEYVPSVRCKRSVLLRKALFRGALVPVHPTFGASDIVKSMIAIPAYTLALPVALILGQHRFMTILVNLFDHVGRLLAWVGIKPIKVAYVTE